MRKYKDLLFGIFISMLFLLPLGFRIAKTAFPGLLFPQKVEPVPSINIRLSPFQDIKIKESLNALTTYAHTFNYWYQYHFTLNKEFLKVYQLIKEKILHTNPFPDRVIEGRDGWLFTGDHFDGSLSEQLGFSRMKDQEIAVLGIILLQYQNWCEENGIFYAFMPVQGKAGFYSRFIPIKKPQEPTTLERLIEQLKLLDVKTIDCRESLQKAGNQQIYLKEDSHWNGHGAWMAYKQMMDTLKKYFPKIEILHEHDVSADTISERMDLADVLNRKSPYPNIFIRPKNPGAKQQPDRLKIPDDYLYVAPANYEFRYTCNNKPLKALIFRDSYFSHLQPPVTESFGETTLIWHRIPDTSLIKSEQPDVVIHQLSERLINDFYKEYKLKHPLKIESLQ